MLLHEEFGMAQPSCIERGDFLKPIEVHNRHLADRLQYTGQVLLCSQLVKTPLCPAQ